MDFQKLTIKSQEAVAAAQDIARRRGNPELTPDHLLLALLDQELFTDWQQLRAEAERSVDALPSVQGGAQQPNASAAFARVLDGRRGARPAGRRLHLHRAPVPRARTGAARRDPQVDQGDPRQPARDVAGSGRHLPGALQVRPRPHRVRGGGEARPGDRARRGDPPRDPDPLPAHEEQPRPDWRARRRQDGDRRGTRAADRRRRRPGGLQGPQGVGARHRRAARRREVPRRVRGAPEGGARRDQGRATAASSSSSTSCTRSSARAPPKAPSTPPTC